MKHESLYKQQNPIKHNLIQSYLKIKNDNLNKEKTVLSYFTLNVSERQFTQKATQESFILLSAAKGNEIHSFQSSVDNKDKGICDYPFGFTIFTLAKKYVLFASSQIIYKRWIDGLADLFSTINKEQSAKSINITFSNFTSPEIDSNDTYIKKNHLYKEEEDNRDLKYINTNGIDIKTESDNTDLINVFNKIKNDNIVCIESSLDTSYSSNESPFENPFNIKTKKKEEKDFTIEEKKNSKDLPNIHRHKDVDKSLVYKQGSTKDESSINYVKESFDSLAQNVSSNNKYEKTNNDELVTKRINAKNNSIMIGPENDISNIIDCRKLSFEDRKVNLCKGNRMNDTPTKDYEKVNINVHSNTPGKNNKIYSSSIKTFKEELKSLIKEESFVPNNKNPRKGSQPVKSRLKMETIEDSLKFINDENGISKSVVANENEFILNITIRQPLQESVKKAKKSNN